MPEVRIYADTIANLEELEYVRDTYLPEAQLFQAKPHIDAPSGTWNILTSIKEGYKSDAELVFLIEEDILVKPDYFDWAYREMSTGRYAAVCGRKDAGFYPLYPDIYTNPGSCLHRALIEHLIPHINDDYFARLRGYLDEHFGLWPEMSALDDGLIRRVIRQTQGKVLYPDVPKCAHIGWRLYNKIDIYMNHETDLENRIARLRALMASIRPGDRYAKDFEF